MKEVGCDIHLYVEAYRYIDGNWKWVHAQGMEQCNDYGYFDVPFEKKIYTYRNYALFSILAGVREYSSGINIICESKGLPTTVSNDIRERSESWGEDGHSHSYLTLQEIFDFDWTQTVHMTGFTNGIQYFEWNRFRRDYGLGPERYTDESFGERIVTVTQEEMQKSIHSIVNRNGGRMFGISDQIEHELGSCFCEVEWEEPYYRLCDNFWREAIPRLLTFGRPENVRIVFWFDN